MKKRFWLSWIQPTEDMRPLTDPPTEGVLGWWCSGYDSNDWPILCALVQGKDLKDAKATVARSWPEVPSGEWRIESSRSSDWLPGDRFPLEAWMTELIAAERREAISHEE